VQPKVSLDTVHPEPFTRTPFTRTRGGTVMSGNNRNLLIDGDFQAVDLTSGDPGVFTEPVAATLPRLRPPAGAAAPAA
jgi:hypothetical protein